MLIVDTLKTLLSEVVNPLEVASFRARVLAKVESGAFKVMTVSIYSAHVGSSVRGNSIVQVQVNDEERSVRTYGVKLQSQCKRLPGTLQLFPSPGPVLSLFLAFQ